MTEPAVLTPRQQLNFYRRVVFTPGCWKWTGAHTPQGYGTHGWRQNGRQRGAPAHRTMYRLVYGDPGDLQLDHQCDNRWCVNPHHLKPATAEQNRRWGDFRKASPEEQEHLRYFVKDLFR